MITDKFVEVNGAIYFGDLKPGEGIRFIDNKCPKGRKIKLILCCPNCGRVSSKPNLYIPETKTLSPSIICGDQKVTGCGWHGWLKNGIFTNA